MFRDDLRRTIRALGLQMMKDQQTVSDIELLARIIYLSRSVSDLEAKVEELKIINQTRSTIWQESGQ